jgi:hypothetical protein
MTVHLEHIQNTFTKTPEMKQPPPPPCKKGGVPFASIDCDSLKPVIIINNLLAAACANIYAYRGGRLVMILQHLFRNIWNYFIYFKKDPCLIKVAQDMSKNGFFKCGNEG